MNGDLGSIFFKLNREGLPFSSIARRYGLTKGKVAGMIRRHQTFNTSIVRLLDPSRFEWDNADRWVEEKLIEKWADRKIRIKKEKERAHA